MSERKPKDQDSTPDQNAQPNPATQQEVTQQPDEGIAPATPQNPVSSGPLSPENNPLLPKEEPKKLDETIPGGKYKTPDGRTVNANNEPIDENGKVIKPS